MVAADAPDGRARPAAGVAAAVAGTAVDEPARPRCADAAAVAPAAADAEIGEDGAPGRAAPQLVPVAAPIVDTPSRSSSDYLTRASNYSRGTPFPPSPLPRPQCPARITTSPPRSSFHSYRSERSAPLLGDIRTMTDDIRVFQ